MKDVKVTIIEKNGPCLLLDLGFDINSEIFDLINKLEFANICRGIMSSKTKEFLHSYFWIEMNESDIGKLEKSLFDYINNAR